MSDKRGLNNLTPTLVLKQFLYPENPLPWSCIYVGLSSPKPFHYSLLHSSFNVY